jgi:type III secretion protein C
MSSAQANQNVCFRISRVARYFAYLDRRFSLVSKRLPAALIAVIALAGLIAPAQGSDPRWPDGPYKYLVIDQDIKDVLTEFGRNIDVPVEVSNQVKGRLRGQLPVATAKEFLNKLCESYGLVWYFDGATLHVSAKTEVKTELINIGRLPVKNLTDQLNTLGIADPRFPVRSTPDGGVISVSGPAPYLAMVRQTLTAMARSAAPVVREDKADDEIRVRVFRGNTSELSKPVTHGPVRG